MNQVIHDRGFIDIQRIRIELCLQRMRTECTEKNAQKHKYRRNSKPHHISFEGRP